jgi:hypothetical protein
MDMTARRTRERHPAPSRRSGGRATVFLPFLFASVLSACGGENVIPTWGHDGYALLRGEVRLADGSPFAGGSLFITCGPDAPGFFTAGGSTDQEGDYEIQIAAPTGIRPGATGEFELICEVRARVGTTTIARASGPVRFHPSSPPITVMDLQEEPDPGSLP